jgi:septal ring factor EnvC (AmiA/AmiB activator)
MKEYLFKRVLSIIIVLLIGGLTAYSQSKSELQKKKKQLQKEIEYTNKLIKQTSQSKQASLNQLQRIDKQISTRQELINTMEAEIEFINDSITATINLIDTLTKDINQLKKEYAEMIQSAYVNRSSYNKFMYIFSSASYNQAFKRLKYFQQYAEYRKKQAESIRSKQIEYDQQLLLLEAIKKSKEGLLKAKLNEKNQLTNEKDRKVSVVNELKGKENSLRKQLQEKEKAAKEISKAIARIIEEEIRKAREAAKNDGRSTKGFPMTPEAIELSNSFAANKGKLPWPVQEGVITAQYGEHPHPTLKDVKVQNNGVDISTTKANTGRAIFEGTVSRVIIIPGEGKVVMIRHGEYFTVYFYFKEVFVSAGDKIDTKQKLGVLISEDDESSSIMHLEIWKVTNKMNPEEWIYKTNKN